MPPRRKMARAATPREQATSSSTQRKSLPDGSKVQMSWHRTLQLNLKESASMPAEPQRDPNSWSFERTLAYDLLIMCTFWTLFQLAVFCVPVRESFDCAKVPTFAFSKMPAGYIDSCNRVVSIAHALFCTIGALIYFASDSNMYIKCKLQYCTCRTALYG